MIRIGSIHLCFSALGAAVLVLLPLSCEGQTTATAASGWLERAAEREVQRATRSPAWADSVSLVAQQPGAPNRSWIGRHPALFGTLVGFAGGFLIGYAAGDDGIFDDFTAGFNGCVMGGIGAGTGATVGALVGSLRK